MFTISNYTNVCVTTLRVLVFALPLLAQNPPRSAQDAYDRIQALRTEGRELMASEPEQALEKFEAALRYWQQPLAQSLARGNMFLENRYLNLCIDFAETHAKLKHNAEAIAWLEKAHQAGSFDGFARHLEQSPNYEVLRSDPAFQKLLAASRQRPNYWEPPPPKTPYREKLADAEKIAGLSKFWSEVKYNFAYPERLTEIDWDRLYLEAIPKVLAMNGTAEYYRELMRLCALIGDGHTNVFYPDALKLTAKPPLKTLLIDGLVAVTNVYAPALEVQGIRAGMEILEVDGEVVYAYVKREVTPFQSASTPQDLAVRSYWYGFLHGPEDQPVKLKLRSPDGSVTEKTVARTGYKQIKYPGAFEYRALPNGIAYVRADSFSDEKIVGQWKEKLPETRTAKALILDLRSNGGGSSNIGWALLSTLIDKPTEGARTRMRRYIPTERAWGMNQVQFVTDPPSRIEPDQGPRFTGPVIVLTSGATYSAAEDFLIAFQSSGRGRIVGEASGGSTGQPLPISLPGGGSARICTKQDLTPDGKKWVGVGIRPHIEVKPSWADFVQGRDTVLEAALKLLQ
jgi:C-terminal processing protease CtpA/Prc